VTISEFKSALLSCCSKLKKMLSSSIDLHITKELIGNLCNPVVTDNFSFTKKQAIFLVKVFAKQKSLFIYSRLMLLLVIAMGHSWVEVEISDLEKKKSAVVKALVDTGASLTVLPKKLTDELGIAATSEEKVTTGAGEIKVKGADVWLKIRGREKTNPVWISDIIDKVLIGAVTLGSLGFAVDPKTGTLREEPLLLY